MTIETQGNKKSWTGDALTTIYAYPYPFQKPADIEVYLDGVKQTSGYSVQILPDYSGGANIEFTTAPDNGVTIVIKRNIQITQEVSYPENGEFPAKSHEKALDKLTLIALDSSSETIKINPGTNENFDLTIPEPVEKKVLRIKPDGTGFEFTDMDVESVNQTVADSLADITNAKDLAIDAVEDTGETQSEILDEKINVIANSTAQAQAAAVEAIAAKNAAVQIVDPSGEAYYAQIANNTDKLSLFVNKVIPTYTQQCYITPQGSIVSHSSTAYATTDFVDLKPYRGKTIAVYTCWSGYNDAMVMYRENDKNVGEEPIKVAAQSFVYSNFLQASVPGYIFIQVPQWASHLRYTMFTLAVQQNAHILVPIEQENRTKEISIYNKIINSVGPHATYINSGGGVTHDVVYNPGYCISGLIEVEPLSKLHFKHIHYIDTVQYYLYDEFYRKITGNRNLPIRNSDFTIDIPLNARYIQLTIPRFLYTDNFPAGVSLQPDILYIKPDIVTTGLDPMPFSGSQWIPYSEINHPLYKIKKDPGFLECFPHVACIGDSLASGESVGLRPDGSAAYVDNYTYSWGQYLARRTGQTYYNFSSGGLTAKSWLASGHATRCFSDAYKCEAYIIALGVNEGWQHMTLGTSADIDPLDYHNNADSYYGNLARIVQMIKEFQPKGKIFLLTPPADVNETDGYNDAVRHIANMFTNVYLVDLYKYGYAHFNSGFLSNCWRGGHSNALGYSHFASIISTYIDWIIRKKFDEFREIEFIGTNYHYY